jgi:hypothetical protein
LVQTLSARQGQLVVERLTDQGMAEVVARAVFSEEARPQGVFQRVQNRGRREIDHRLEDVEAEGLAQHRRRLQQQIGFGAQPRQTTADNQVHAFGDAPPVRRVAEILVLFTDVAHELDCEKRVAGCFPIDRINHRLGGRHAIDVLDQRGSLLAGQRLERQTLIQTLTAELGQHAGERMGTRKFDGAVRANQEHGHACGPPGEVQNELQRGYACPLEVVQSQDQSVGSRSGNVIQERTDTLEKPVALTFGVTQLLIDGRSAR